MMTSQFGLMIRNRLRDIADFAIAGFLDLLSMFHQQEISKFPHIEISNFLLICNTLARSNP
jgi:hypothetical protein